jgi:hypothetical protein
MTAPPRAVTGGPLSHSRPTSRFPAAVQMDISSALCDVLIGRRPWTDPQALEERDILLGSDDAAALQYIQEVRCRLIDNYRTPDWRDMNGNIMGRIPSLFTGIMFALIWMNSQTSMPKENPAEFPIKKLIAQPHEKKTLNFWHLARLGPFASDPSSMTGSNSHE